MLTKSIFFLVLVQSLWEIYTYCNEICRQRMLQEVWTNNGRRKCNLKVFFNNGLEKFETKLSRIAANTCIIQGKTFIVEVVSALLYWIKLTQYSKFFYVLKRIFYMPIILYKLEISLAYKLVSWQLNYVIWHLLQFTLPFCI